MMIPAAAASTHQGGSPVTQHDSSNAELVEQFGAMLQTHGLSWKEALNTKLGKRVHHLVRRGEELDRIAALYPVQAPIFQLLKLLRPRMQENYAFGQIATWAVCGELNKILLYTLHPSQNFPEIRDEVGRILEGVKISEPEILYAAAVTGDAKTIQMIAGLYSDEDLTKALCPKNDDLCPLGALIERNDAKAILAFREIFARLDTDTRLNLLLNPGNGIRDVLVGRVRGHEILPALLILLKDLSPKERVEILHGSVPSDHLTLSRAIKGRAAYQVLEILKLLDGTTPEERAPLIADGKNLLCAAAESTPEVLEALIGAFSIEELKPLMHPDQGSISPLVQAILPASGERSRERVLALKPLMDSLDPQDQAAVLHKENPREFLKDVAWRGGKIRHLLEFYADAQFKKALEVGEDGDSLLYRLTSFGSIEDLKAVFERMDVQTRRKLLDRDWEGKHPLMNAKDSMTPTLLEILSDEELSWLMRPDKQGRTVLHHWVDVRGISFLLDRLTPPLLVRAMAPDRNGDTPLHHLARGCVINNLANLKSKLEWDTIVAAMRPNKQGQTPVHIGMANPMVQMRHLMSHLALECGDETLADALAPDYRGSTLIHYALTHQDRPVQTLGYVTKLYERAGVSMLPHALAREANGETPLTIAIWKGFHEVVDWLINIAGVKAIARCFKPATQGLVPVPVPVGDRTKLYERLRLLIPHLEDPWDLGLALGDPESDNELYANALLPQRKLFIEYLNERSSDELLRVLLMNCVYYGRKRESVRKEGGWIVDLLTQIDPILSAPMEKEGCPQQQEKLELRKSLLESALVLTAWEGMDLKAFAPLVASMQKMADDSMYHELCKLMACFPLRREQGVATITPWMEAAAVERKPCFFLLALNALEQRGVPQGLRVALKDKYFALSTRYNDHSKEGVQMLRGLVQLAQCDDLRLEDLARVLEELLRGDLPSASIALGQILDMRAIGALRDALTAGPVDLPALAKACFRRLVPMTDRDDFAEKYQESFASQRSPGALITYASRIATEAETRAELGQWIDSVFDGSFHEKRYSDEQNPHLQMVYQKAPHLRASLPQLATEITPTQVGGDSDRGGVINPLNEKVLREKILDDQHLDHARFSEIVAFLGSTRNLRRIQKSLTANKMAVIGDLRRETTPQKQKALEICKLEQQLQMLLCKFCTLKDSNQVVPALRAALEISAQLEARGAGLGEFANDLNAALAKVKATADSAVDNFEVSVTDDYWDLLLIGSDVKDSCQRVDGYPNLNKCLLSYVMDGKNIALVVRRPGSKSIVARRMLRIELDQNDQPVLYLERLYSNYGHESIDTAITEMAKQVANKLQLRLYTAGGSQKLHAEKGRNTWTYSDAAGGAMEGGYEFATAQLIHEPVESDVSDNSNRVFAASSS